MYKRLFLLLAALALFGTGYFLGASSFSVTQAIPLQQANCQSFPETGKTVCGRFLKYWQEHGGLAQQGYPISSEFVEVSDLNGKSYTVQYFERAEFEYHPENADPQFQVLLSQLGLFEYKRKYPNGVPDQPTPGVPPAPTVAVPQTVTKVEMGAAITANGVTFLAKRVDRLTKRIDVNFEITNNTGAPLQLSIPNSNQSLSDNVGGTYEQANPAGSISATLQNGQTYQGATTFFTVDFSTRPDIKSLTYQLKGIPGIGTIQLEIAPFEE